MESKWKILWILAYFSMLPLTISHAETVINNYSSQTPGPNGAQNQEPNNTNNNCNAANNSSDNGLRGGHYMLSNPNGSVDQVYTTGDKKPYIVDNNCNNNNNQTPIQPYININPPGSTGQPSGPPVIRR